MSINPAAKTDSTKVIPMVNLPYALRTIENQNRYDLDGSGYIELVNTQGENEYDTFVAEHPIAKLYTKNGNVVETENGDHEFYDAKGNFQMRHERWEGARDITYADGKKKYLNFEYESDFSVKLKNFFHLR